MSLLNPATAYRRSTNRPRVPVVLPQVRVNVNEQGLLDMTVDEVPFPDADPDAASRLSRAALRPLLDQIARERGSALRVEIHEPGGKVFIDFHTLEPAPTDVAPPVSVSPVAFADQARDQRARPSASLGAGEVGGSGFVSGEEVAVAIVIYRGLAAADGTVQVRLPVALLERHHADVVLIGETSGAVGVSSDQVYAPVREAS